MDGWIDSGFDHLEPLSDYRDWLKEMEKDPTKRQLERRNGAISWTFDESGKNITGHNHGPFTLVARQELLDRLLQVQQQVGEPLISEDEIASIRRIWCDDASGICGRLIAMGREAEG
jgi:DNA sulfur modification protein DndC